jgi:NAD(P)-dependent dehydrogenase (short-subunit alcohol dehydrogenase family)
MAASDRKIAFVTGASRGIGRCTSLALAEKGYDVVVTARTLKEGEGIARSSSARDDKQVSISGSLETTAAAIARLGQEALAIRLDLLDRDSCLAAVDRALSEWGHIDVLVNNGIYQGPGTMDRFLDVPIERLEAIFLANVFNQVAITQKVLPQMLERGGGTIVNMTSATAHSDPPGPLGEGGWGFAYGASKGALHRIAGVLHAEHHQDGIRIFNVDPDYTPTDTQRALSGGDHTDIDATFKGHPPEATGAAIAWLATDPEAARLSGTLVYGARLSWKKKLVPQLPAAR